MTSAVDQELRKNNNIINFEGGSFIDQSWGEEKCHWSTKHVLYGTTKLHGGKVIRNNVMQLWSHNLVDRGQLIPTVIQAAEEIVIVHEKFKNKVSNLILVSMTRQEAIRRGVIEGFDFIQLPPRHD